MKKIFMLITSVVGIFIISGCSNKDDKEKLNVVATIFPYYDIVSEVAKDSDNIELELLIDSGADLHSYQATSDDIISINNADVIVLNGGPSDKWILDAIKNSNNKDVIVVNTMEELDELVLEEEHVEGMEEHDHNHEHEHNHDHEHERNHDHEHEHNHDHEEEHHEDEHFWLSIKNMKIVTKAIEEALVEADEKSKDKYILNGKNYLTKLDDLDNELKNIVNDSKLKTILVGDRFPFRYLVNDYDLEYYAAFPGCSGETEASFKTIIYLAKKLDENKLDSVLILDGSDGSVAKTIIESSNDKTRSIKVLNSMQSLGKKDINKVSYVSIMKENINVLKDVLK